MDRLESYGDFKPKGLDEFHIQGNLDISALEKKLSSKIDLPKLAKSDIFSMRLEDTLEPTHSAKELIERIIKAALEVEFGPSFTLSKGFDRMVSTIADSVITNPELRRQALSVASVCIGKKIAVSKEKERTKKKND
jgi:hypothetical protein